MLTVATYCWFRRDAAHITNCLHTINNYLHDNIFCPGQNMQQTFLKFVEIYFCLSQKYKTGVLHGKNRNQGKSFLPKYIIAYQNTLSKQSTQNVIKALPVVIKTSESNNLKGDPLEIQHPKFENSRLGLILFMRDNVTSLTPPNPDLSATRLRNKILNPKDQKM